MYGLECGIKLLIFISSWILLLEPHNFPTVGFINLFLLLFFNTRYCCK